MLQESSMSTNSSCASSSLYEDVFDAVGLFAIRVGVLLRSRICEMFQSRKVGGQIYPNLKILII